jgi:hypothetical protein
MRENDTVLFLFFKLFLDIYYPHYEDTLIHGKPEMSDKTRNE